jgi:hypothetical protein
MDKGKQPKVSSKRPTKKWWLVLAIVLLAGVVALVLFLTRPDSQPAEPTEITYEQRAKSIIEAGDDDASLAQVTELYGSNYDSTVEEVLESDRAKWDKTALNKAYFDLVYADKVGAFSQVEKLLGAIYGAQQLGVDIDDNDVGIGQAERDAMQKRVTERMENLHNQVQTGDLNQ